VVVRKHMGAIFVGLGVFVLGVAGLTKFWAYDQVAVVPLDQFAALPSDDVPDPEDPPNVGFDADAKIFSIPKLKAVKTSVTSIRNTIGQVDDSEELNDETGENLVIYETFQFNVDSDKDILSGTYDRVIFDRNTGEAYHCDEALADLCDEKTGTANIDTNQDNALGSSDDIAYVYPGEADNFEHGFEGHYFKLPFDTQKQTYTWWDGDIGKATDAKYDGEDTLNGMPVYRFVQTIPATKIGEQEIPASLAGLDQDGNVKVDSMYSNTRTLWIEPETGVLIKGQEKQHNYFAYQGKNVVTTVDGTITYNAATVAANVDKFRPLSNQLKLVRVYIPIIGLVVGLVFVAFGAFLIVQKRRHRAARLS
jgi:hypothetical protein